MSLHSGMKLIGSQRCTDRVEVKQIGINALPQNQITIVPRFRFTCNGRIFNISMRVLLEESFIDNPYIQIWRPLSSSSWTYNKIGEVEVQENYVQQYLISGENRNVADIPLASSYSIWRCCRILSST